MYIHPRIAVIISWDLSASRCSFPSTTQSWTLYASIVSLKSLPVAGLVSAYENIDWNSYHHKVPTKFHSCTYYVIMCIHVQYVMSSGMVGGSGGRPAAPVIVSLATV